MPKINTIVIGTGGFARWKIREILAAKRTTRLGGFIEPSQEQRKLTHTLIEEELKLDCPPFFESLQEIIATYGVPDVAYIISPHKYHIEHIRECLNAGINVLVEKPMVLSQKEAKEVIALRDKTGKLVVVGFPGSLSPAMTKAKQMIADGAIGPVQGVVGICHQGWKRGTANTWRQDPVISGGGFLFDTGSHMINTIVDLIGQDLAEVHAMVDNCGAPVEINSTVLGTFASGIKLSLIAIGDSFDCRGDIRVIGQDGVIEIGMWGHYLKLFTPKTKGGYIDVKYGKPKNTWENFVDVYSGKKANPCPPEVGLRFAQLMDMIRESAKKGKPIKA
ncbi:MAG: Gfo/Idh/MocA family oxidoreductase [Verrucomicrobiota bacterium]|nr:Gfo/Idh/MocA family oxidoreductase [Verrucomicrobiota bacterium]